MKKYKFFNDSVMKNYKIKKIKYFMSFSKFILVQLKIFPIVTG